MTPQEFAGKVREKYPGAYDEIDDITLAQKVIEKYPVYASQVNFESPEEPGVFDSLKTLYGGGENGIAMKLKKDIEQGAEGYSKGVEQMNQAQNVKESFKGLATATGGLLTAGFRTAGDVAQTVYAPVATALDAATGGLLTKGFQRLGEMSQEEGGLMDKITDLPFVQEFAMKHPEAGEDFSRALTLIMAGMDKGQIKPKQMLAETEAAVTKTVGAVKTGVEAVKTGVEAVKSGIETVKQAPGKVLSGVEKLVQKPMAKPVENVLKETKRSEFNKYTKLATDASQSYKAPTPLEYVGTRAQAALDVIQRKLEGFGKQKQQVTNQASIGSKPVGSIVVKFRQELGNYIKSKTLTGGDKGLMQRVMSEAEKLGANPKAGAVDKFVDYVQNEIYSSRRNLTIPVTDEITASLRQLTGQLNSNLKSQLPASYSTVNSKYAKFVDLRNELNAKLGLEGEKGGALMKRVFSPSDAGTKKLFADIYKETGIDLVNEATLARYVMEAVGDARQASLLEQLQLPKLTAGGLTNFLFDKATQRFNTPEAVLKRAEKLTQGGYVKNPFVSAGTDVMARLERHIEMGRQVLNEMPKEMLTKDGGMANLLDRVKTNIIDDLKTKPEFKSALDKIQKIDVTKMTSLDQLGEQVLSLF